MRTTTKGFTTCDQKGFHITFSNGWTISVQFGRGNYCDNSHWEGDKPDDPASAYKSKAPKSRNAEVAAWPSGGDMIALPEGDTVGARWTPEQVLYLQSKLVNLKQNETPDFSDWEQSP